MTNKKSRPIWADDARAALALYLRAEVHRQKLFDVQVATMLKDIQADPASVQLSEALRLAMNHALLDFSDLRALFSLTKVIAETPSVNLFTQGALTVVATDLDASALQEAAAMIMLSDQKVGFSNYATRNVGLRVIDSRRLMSKYRSENDDLVLEALQKTRPTLFVDHTNALDLSRYPDGIWQSLDLQRDWSVVQCLFELFHPETADEVFAYESADLAKEASLREVSDLDLLIALRLTRFGDAVAYLRSKALKRDADVVVRPQSEGPTLTELAGLGRAKDYAEDLIEAMTDWKEGRLVWSDVPRGLLLVGAPGTGKTELARAMARSGNIRLEMASYNEWQKSGSLSEFLSAMERSFKSAQSNAPCILFIDELDAFFRRNGGGPRSHNDSYDTKAITGFLERLDGVIEYEGVVVLAATNSIESIDPAILRAGRFDQIVEILPPNQEDLSRIIDQYLGDLSDAVDLDRCALMSLGKTGAEVRAAVKQAKMSVRKRQRRGDASDFTTEDYLKALNQSMPALSPKDWYRIAVHECGHAIVATALPYIDVDFIRLDDDGGICSTQTRPHILRAEELHHQRAYALAGYFAEKLIFGDVAIGSGGSEKSDLAKATTLAAQQITSFGLGEIGPIWLGSSRSDTLVSDAINGHLPELSKLIQQSQDFALDILRSHEGLLRAMATALCESAILSGDALSAFLSQVSPAFEVEEGL